MRALLFSAAVASLFLFAPAKAEIVAVCSASGDPAAEGYGSAGVLKLLGLRDTKPAASVSRLALWHDDKGYDVLLNWGAKNQLSLRAEGADIMGNDLEDGFIHLAVARAGGSSFEHFLFSWDDHPVGELLWSVPGDAGASDSDVQMACIERKR